jgi:peptidoglycan/LPS O-acetylase OafA/YrhL
MTFSGPPVAPLDRGFKNHIAGLRGIAVLGIVFFHFGVAAFPGGYVGVDVFFVISGYLISQRLYADLADGTFSLTGFFERRARRIAPAFIVVSVVTTALAAVILYPVQLVDYAQSLIWSVLLSGNAYFYAHSDYFAPAAHELPLLHYWSLGVEEQFYVLFPLILLACIRFGQRTFAIAVCLLFIVSLIASETTLQVNPPAAFYLLPFRAFELLLGAALALPEVPAVRRRVVAGVTTGVGCGLIVGAMVLFSERTTFPGVMALVPCAGAALVIWGGDAGLSSPGRLVSVRPLMFFGAISYSLYLVHWPIVVFTRIVAPGLDPSVFAVGALVASTVLAWLSYRFVEQPMLRQRRRFNRPIVFGAVAAGAVTLVASGIAIRALDGMPWRVDDKVAALAAYGQYAEADSMFRAGVCFLRADQPPSDLDPQCLPTDKPNVILWGSSYVAHLWWGLAPLLAERGYALGQATASACRPLIGFDTPDLPHCADFNAFALAWLLENRPSMVIVDGAINNDAELQLLDASVQKLKAAGIHVVILGAIPLYNRPVPIMLADWLQEGRYDNRATPEDFLNSWPIRADAITAPHFGSDPSVTYVSLLSVFCPDAMCVVEEHGVPLLYDSAHFTKQGSAYCAAAIVDRIVSRL